MPLGAARTAQLSNFWSTGLKQISFSSTSAVTDVIERPTGYSWATRDANSGQFNNAFLSPSASIDISPITGYSTYNYLRSTQVATFYCDGTTWSGWPTPNSNFSVLRTTFVNTDVLNVSNEISVGLFSGLFSVNGNFVSGSAQAQGLALSNPSTYYNRFLSVVLSTAETSSVFASWAGSTGTGVAMRLALYDTQTGVLIAKADKWNNNTTDLGRIDWATKFGTTLAVNQTFTANTAFVAGFGVGADTDTGNPLTRYGCYWLCFGTMFDPLQETNTSWLTNAPARQIGNAQVMIQSQFTEYDDQNPQYYNKSPAGVSLYSQTDRRDWVSSLQNNASAADMYSATIKIRNS